MNCSFEIIWFFENIYYSMSYDLLPATSWLVGITVEEDWLFHKVTLSMLMLSATEILRSMIAQPLKWSVNGMDDQEIGALHCMQPPILWAPSRKWNSRGRTLVTCIWCNVFSSIAWWIIKHRDKYSFSLEVAPILNYSPRDRRKSWCNDWLRTGRPRGRSLSPSRVKNFLYVVLTGSGVYPTSYPMGTGSSFSRDKAAGTWSWPLTSS
jgi:hypothetical protein